MRFLTGLPKQLTDLIYLQKVSQSTFFPERYLTKIFVILTFALLTIMHWIYITLCFEMFSQITKDWPQQGKRQSITHEIT